MGNETKPEDMTKEDRQRVVLSFLDETGLALPQGAIFRNLKLHHGVTFSYSAVDNYLDDFVRDGLCRRVDPEELETGDLVDLPEGEGQAYYIITEAGRQYLRD